MFPKMIYFDSYESGQKHKKCILNLKIDFNFQRKVLKSDIIPFFELQISRRATFSVLKEVMVSMLQAEMEQNDLRVGGDFEATQTVADRRNSAGALLQLKEIPSRLHIDDLIIEDAQLEQTLEAFGLQSGNLVLIEFFDKDKNLWPNGLTL